MFNRIPAVALASCSMAAQMAVALNAKAERNAHRIYGFDNIRRALQRQGRNYGTGQGSIATGNRHGGPHLHQREIARRQRQGAARHA